MIKPRRITSMQALFCAFATTICFGSWILLSSQTSHTPTKLLADPTFIGEKECGDFPCFGTTLCRDFHDGYVLPDVTTHVKYKSWSIYRGKIVDRRLPERYRNCTIRTLESKCSHKDGVCDEEEVDSESSIKQFRQKVCVRLGRGRICDLVSSIQKWEILNRVKKLQGILPVKHVRGLATPLRCASQRFVNRIVRCSIANHGYYALTGLSTSDKATLVFKMKFAPGSWMQEAFPAHEGWPFGATYGACGRILVHRHVGETNLRQMKNASWKIRVDLASQLLDIALKLTENDARYLFLFHRLTEEDFVVDEQGKLRVENLDEVIVVDKQQVEKARREHWNETYRVQYASTGNKIEENNLCRYKDADVNIFFVCSLLLDRGRKNGLLHDPEEKEEFASKIDYLVDVCIRGEKSTITADWPGLNLRFAAAKKLREHLGYIRPCSPEVPYRFPECENLANGKDLYHVPWFEML